MSVPLSPLCWDKRQTLLACVTRTACCSVRRRRGHGGESWPRVGYGSSVYDADLPDPPEWVGVVRRLRRSVSFFHVYRLLYLYEIHEIMCIFCVRSTYVPRARVGGVMPSSRKELKADIPDIHAESIEELREAFDLFDTKGAGMLQRSERSWIYGENTSTYICTAAVSGYNGASRSISYCCI